MNKRILKHLFGVFMVLALANVACAAEAADNQGKLDWDRDVRVAWRSALEVDRPLLVFVTMDDCLYCTKMKKTTLRDRHVVKDLQTQFVPVTLNVKDAPDFVELLQVKSYPTTVIIQTNGDVVESIPGYQTAKQLRDRLHTTIRQVARERDPVKRR